MNKEVFTAEVIGVDELIYSLNNLPDQVAAGILESMIREAINKTVMPPLRYASSYPTNKEAAVIERDKERRASYYAGISNDMFYYWFIDQGTKDRYTYYKRGHKYRGRIEEAHPYWSTVLDEVADKPFEYIQEHILNRILTYLDRRNKAVLRKLRKYGIE